MNNPFEDLKAELIEEFKTLLSSHPGNNVSIQPLEQPVTTDELCKWLRISEPSLIRLKKKKRIPFIEIGGSIRYDKAAVVRALEKKEAENHKNAG